MSMIPSMPVTPETAPVTPSGTSVSGRNNSLGSQKNDSSKAGDFAKVLDSVSNETTPGETATETTSPTTDTEASTTETLPDTAALAGDLAALTLAAATTPALGDSNTAIVQATLTESTSDVGLVASPGGLTGTPISQNGAAETPVSTGTFDAEIPVDSDTPVRELPVDDSVVTTDEEPVTTSLTEALAEAMEEATAATPKTVSAVASVLAEKVTGIGGIETTSTVAVDSMSPTVTRTPEHSALGSTESAKPQVPVEPHKQIVNIVSPLRHAADGDYRMTLRLSPEQLGHVEVAVTLANGQISMQLTADNAMARSVLRDSLNDLRTSLVASGLSTGALDVGTSDSRRESGNSQPDGQARGTRPSESDEAKLFARLAEVTAISTATTDGPLDIRV